jgi:DNA-binding transcriptional MerR regulator
MIPNIPEGVLLPNIPERLFYRIKEVCTYTGLKPHILRYWEQEFRDIQPVKSPRGQRLYRKRDLDAIFLIKKLLYEKRFTIDGAKKYLHTQKTLVDEIKEDLREIVKLLEKGDRA